MQVETCRDQAGKRGEISNFYDWGRDCASARRYTVREDIFHFAADHRRDELAVSGGTYFTGVHAGTIPQHCVAVGDFADFLKKMTDVEDGDALLAQPANDAKQAFDTVLCQAAGGLAAHQ